jgi:hypothetical protein
MSAVNDLAGVNHDASVPCARSSRKTLVVLASDSLVPWLSWSTSYTWIENSISPAASSVHVPFGTMNLVWLWVARERCTTSATVTCWLPCRASECDVTPSLGPMRFCWGLKASRVCVQAPRVASGSTKDVPLVNAPRSAMRSWTVVTSDTENLQSPFESPCTRAVHGSHSLSRRSASRGRPREGEEEEPRLLAGAASRRPAPTPGRGPTKTFAVPAMDANGPLVVRQPWDALQSTLVSLWISCTTSLSSPSKPVAEGAGNSK